MITAIKAVHSAIFLGLLASLLVTAPLFTLSIALHARNFVRRAIA